MAIERIGGGETQPSQEPAKPLKTKTKAQEAAEKPLQAIADQSGEKPTKPTEKGYLLKRSPENKSNISKKNSTERKGSTEKKQEKLTEPPPEEEKYKPHPL